MDRLDAPLAVTLLSREDRDERVTLASFGVAVGGWANLVRRLTLERSGARPALEWVVDRLMVGSATVAVIGIPRTDEAERVEREVTVLVVDGLERVERGEDPFAVFSPEAAEHAQDMIRVLADGVGQIVVRNRERQVELTREGTGRAQEATPRLVSLGSVEGTVKTVSFSENRPYFSVFRSRDGRAVRCYFDERRELDRVLDLLRRRDRVLVVGRLLRSTGGTPYAVTDVREIRRLRGREGLPQVDDILGIDPDLTEDLASEEWLRRRRG